LTKVVIWLHIVTIAARSVHHSSIALLMVWTMPSQTCSKLCFSSQNLFTWNCLLFTKNI